MENIDLSGNDIAEKVLQIWKNRHLKLPLDHPFAEDFDSIFPSDLDVENGVTRDVSSLASSSELSNASFGSESLLPSEAPSSPIQPLAEPNREMSTWNPSSLSDGQVQCPQNLENSSSEMDCVIECVAELSTHHHSYGGDNTSDRKSSQSECTTANQKKGVDSVVCHVDPGLVDNIWDDVKCLLKSRRSHDHIRAFDSLSSLSPNISMKYLEKRCFDSFFEFVLRSDAPCALSCRYHLEHLFGPFFSLSKPESVPWTSANMISFSLRSHRCCSLQCLVFIRYGKMLHKMPP
jgi:hypothetical protein